MDKNKIKSFAIWARRSLIKSVSEKAYSIGIYEDKILEATAVQGGFKLEGKEEIFTLSKKDRDALVKQVNEKGFEQVMEEVAYTWFNRFMGLRYMEVNDYLPTGIRILSSEVEGKKEPDVLTKVSEIIDELNLNANEIYDLLDTGDTLDREKAYRMILVKQCNELGKIIPQMFEKISDYTELLLPDNLLEDRSVIRKMVEDIEESDWLEEVEIVGWMYQYYNIDNNELVYDGNMKRSRIPKQLLPAATQIFTPNWVVRYLVENSLGKSIMRILKKEDLKLKWKYFIEDDNNKINDINEKYEKLEDIKFLDPSMGSGHILVYAFELLYNAYREQGYIEREIPRLIIQNNLYGIDIDDRAAQLSSFAIIMKARHYNRRFFREVQKENLSLNIISIHESNEITEEVINYFSNKNEVLKEEINLLIDMFKDAKEYGSIVRLKELNYKEIEKRLEEIKLSDNLMFYDFNKIILEKIPYLINQHKLLINKYDMVVTNPPYLNSSRMGERLLNYINKHYPNSKSDLSMVFYEKSINDFCKENSYLAFVTTNSWMFLKSFETVRSNIVKNIQFDSLVDFGTELFEGKVGHNPIVAWVNRKVNPNSKMCAIRLKEFCYSRKDEKKREFFNKNNRYILEQKELLNIQGAPIAYWIGERLVELFKCSKLKDLGNIKVGMQVDGNDSYLRLWYEVKYSDISYNMKNTKDAILSNYTWFPYSKGGKYRKWYGNVEYVVNKSQIEENELYFKQGLTWTRVTSYKASFRLLNEGTLFDNAGPCYFPNDNIYIFLAYLNSIISENILSMLNPTLNIQTGNVSSVPFEIIKDEEKRKRIEEITKRNVLLSKYDWDLRETSWDYKINPLVNIAVRNKILLIEECFNKYHNECENLFNELKENECELNTLLVDNFNLNDEFNINIDDKDITISRANRQENIKQLISYSVGCMFGRYSIDVDGLVYVDGEFEEKWNIEKNIVRKVENCEKIWVDARFLPDKDNIIPITEDEYFEDDIVCKFIEFIKIVFGSSNLEYNLDFIADSIGRKTMETARQTIRRYFIKDFYKDHLKIYRTLSSGARPIYWMFESGKNDGFKCLIYMHRYNEQTVAKVRTDYLHTLQRKYESEMNRLQSVVDSEEYTAKDRTVAKKKIDRISKQIEECKEYDQVVAYLANEKISIDLDDGVKVNYDKFQGIKVINSKGKEVKMNLLAKI